MEQLNTSNLKVSHSKMSAAVLDKPFSIDIKEVAVPVPQEDEALIKVHCIGICGSDVHYYEHGKIGRYVVEQPIILGHELAGEVVQVGAKVKNVSVGDRVAVEPGITCGRCTYCKSGKYNLCPDVQFMATPPVDGAWAEYVAVRSDFLFKLPEEMSYEAGAMLEPLSVGFHAMKRGRVQPGDRLLVQGLGPIGLLAIQSAQLFGITEIYGIDVVPFRLEMAKQLGATAVFNAAEQDVKQELANWTEGEGIDVIIESSGNAKAVTDSVHLVKRGGRIVFVGLPTASEIPLDVTQIVDSELDIYGIFRYANTYPTAIKALSKQQNVDVTKVITHKYGLHEIKEAIEVARTAKDTSIKVMIYP